MDAYPITEGSGQDALLPPSFTTLVNANSLGEQGKRLSIVDSARRDLEATLQLLADRAQYITGASGAAIALRDGERALCRASSGTAAPDLGSCLDLSSGLSGECVRTRAALRCDDVSRDLRVNRESCRRLGIASLAVMPILRNREVIGIFEIFSGKAGAFQERDLTALERLCDMVNTALDEASPERAQASAFAVHGPKMKALAAAASVGTGVLSITGAANSRVEAAEEGFIAGLPGTSERHTETIRDVDRINSCKSCGFPVSEGRRLCLDCEEKGIPVAEVSGLMGASSGGMKAWFLTNRYIIGMVLISAATIAFALLR